MASDEPGVVFPIFQRDLMDLFGEPNEGQFAQDYLRTLDLSDLSEFFPKVKDYTGEPWSHRIYCNYILHDPLRKAFQNLIDSNVFHELKTYDGCFNIRQMSGGGGLSVHSWGMAVDLNAATNPYGGNTSLSDVFVRCFADAGFEWGGLWRTKDGMHFQLCWTKNWIGSNNPLAPVPYVS